MSMPGELSIALDLVSACRTSGQIQAQVTRHLPAAVERILQLAREDQNDGVANGGFSDHAHDAGTFLFLVWSRLEAFPAAVRLCALMRDHARSLPAHAQHTEYFKSLTQKADRGIPSHYGVAGRASERIWSAKHPQQIKMVRGVGYVFTAEVQKSRRFDV
jgi:hypothetical protein